MSRIKEIRERLQVTQAELGEGIGCSQGNVWQYEANNQTLPPDRALMLVKFAKRHGLSLTLDQVYGVKDLPPVASNDSDHKARA
jgi:putative transcriptional regulator